MSDNKIDNLPSKPKARLFNDELYRLTQGVLDLYNVFDEDKGTDFAKIIHDVFIKDILLENLPIEIKKDLKIDERKAFGVAYEYSRRVFADLGEYFNNVNNLLDEWRTKKSPIINKKGDDLKKWDRRDFPDDAMAEDYYIKEEVKIENEKNLLKENLNYEERQISPVNENVNRNIIQNQSIKGTLLTSTRKTTGQLITKGQCYLMPILDALRVNPRVGEQLISKNALKFLNSENLKRPTIRNWLRDYETRMSPKKHSKQERTDYLINSPNVQNITEDDRVRLGVIIKSYDDDNALRFNNQWKVILSKEEELENIKFNNINKVKDTQIGAKVGVDPRYIKKISEKNAYYEEESKRDLNRYKNNQSLSNSRKILNDQSLEKRRKQKTETLNIRELTSSEKNELGINRYGFKESLSKEDFGILNNNRPKIPEKDNYSTNIVSNHGGIAYLSEDTEKEENKQKKVRNTDHGFFKK